MDSQPAIIESTAFKLHRATVLMDRVADRYLHAEHGIHYSSFLVLLMVGTLGRPGQRQLAEMLDVSAASITQRLKHLRAAGLVEIAPDPADARAHLVSLTDQGGTLLEAAWIGLDTHQDGIDAGVDEVVLAHQLDRLIANAVAVLDPTRHPGDAS